MSRNQPEGEAGLMSSAAAALGLSGEPVKPALSAGEIQYTRAVPFIQHVDGKFSVCEEGSALLSAITGPISVIAVAGLYRTGKSFLLNQLVKNDTSKRPGFEVGDTTRSCTRGINVWVPQDHCMQPHNGSTLVLMDTEGMASMDQDETYDALIFSLGLLLSSTFVLNSMGECLMKTIGFDCSTYVLSLIHI